MNESSLLELIQSPDDLKKLDISQLNQLSNEIRNFLITTVSETGGHLASNLGIVELTIALHYSFNTPIDRIIWDVGHQSYVHKMLTGRKDRFQKLRKWGGISGFPKTCESDHDCFNTGHSSTSISAALGFARARDLKKEQHSVIAVIGDGAMTGGMAFEALNDAGRSSSNLIVVLNDNTMSISKNVGGLSAYLRKITSQPFYFKVMDDMHSILNKIPGIGKDAVKVFDKATGSIKYLILPGMIFEELGFKYLGPVDGHNLPELMKIFSTVKSLKGPVLIHICTQKGKGYSHAEENPHLFHGIAPFEVETGSVLKNKGPSYSDIFEKKMLSLAEKEEKIVAITAAMAQGTGLDEFSKKFSSRFFDVGIAEQHAVTFAAGLALNGMIPVVAIYSSFLQRAYDQILHDVAAQDLHVVFAIDRAGIVGEDGETHQGLFDFSFLSHIPNMTILAPCDYAEFRLMLEYAVLTHKGPIAVRYPKGYGKEELIPVEPIENRQATIVKTGKDLTILSSGTMLETALKTGEKLKSTGVDAEIIHARMVKPLDLAILSNSVNKTQLLFTLEDNACSGGFGQYVFSQFNDRQIFVKGHCFGFPDHFIPHGSREELFNQYGLNADSIVSNILEFMKKTSAESIHDRDDSHNRTGHTGCQST
ncbi:MAG: 1-deoxy-D-xylulose-5-phosphate synthase [Candidatus Aureabacteria bacterium]|nr:1-deoxy-D-xylulose-5-phosphate synthase [Candidatus Auribacterota bacterium]